MGHLPLKFIILVNFLNAVSPILHAKGPTHRKLAENCLEHIIREHFHFQYGKDDENHTMLFTVMVSEDMTSPAYEIQDTILRKIHDMAMWYQIEVVSYGQRYEFQSYAECLQDDCQKSFIIDFKSNFYVIVIDDVHNFDVILDVSEESSTFNPNAKYLVYIEYDGPKYKTIAKRILSKMWEKFLVKTAVLIPKTLQVFSFYRLNTATQGPNKCASNITIVETDQCVKGRMVDINKHYYKVEESRDFLNCTVDVIAMPQKPFVISETEGFEIEVLQNIADILNINFRVTVSENLTDNWGSEDEYGNWSGKLKYVYDDYYIGVGNIETGMSYAIDFSFSSFYHMEPLVFVVPVARFVPKWRVLTAIFTVEMWGVCVGIIVGFAVSLYFASKFGKELPRFKTLGNCFYHSFQVIILHAVPVQPVTDLTRVFFLSLTIISIILSSAYTCSLVYYLKNPIREHQPTINSEIRDDFGNYKYGIGGISRYKEMFTFSDEEEGSGLYDMYQTAVGENDTVIYWIKKVAEDRNIWTISSKLFANYLLAQDSNFTDSEGEPKIFVFNKQLISYAISLIARKGHPLLKYIDRVIQKMMWAGLINHMSIKYTEAIEAKQDLRSYGDDDSYQPIAVDHLQGAFGLLLLGCGIGFVTLLIECFVKAYKTRKVRKIEGRVNKVRRITYK